MVQTRIITPKVAEGHVSRQTNLGIDTYDLRELYSPDTAFWKSKVLDLGSPKHQPNGTYAFDRSRYNNHGTITGATWTRLPSGLWELSLDGTDDYVQIAHSTSLVVTGDYTFLQWVKTTSNAAFIANFTDSPAGYTGGFALGIGLATAGNGYLAAINVGANTWLVGVTTLVNNNAWHLVGLRLSGTTLDILLDGAVEATQVDSAPLSYTDVKRLGVSGTGTLDLTGTIALPRLFNVAVSNATITSIRSRERHLFNV